MSNQTAVDSCNWLLSGHGFLREKNIDPLKYGETQVSAVPGDSEVLLGSAQQNRKE